MSTTREREREIVDATTQGARKGVVPVQPSAAAGARLRPLAVDEVRLTGGFWAERQRVNREVSIPIGSSRLREAGNLADLELAAEFLGDPDKPAEPDAYRGPLFMDSDVYKWLEAVSWEHGRQASDELRAEVDRFAAAVAAAQNDDGYVNSFVQVTRAGHERYRDLAMGHELYCFGHLIQAAVAAHRVFGDCELWRIAVRAADHLVDTFGPGKNPGLDGHPVIEMALVELYRESDDRRYLDLAEHFVNTRGKNTIHGWNRDPIYYSDRLPVRDTIAPEGHAVRAVYLAAGASDVAAESAESADLAAALETQWHGMVDSKQYITGGLGSRWDGEAFGDPYELPPDVAYAETCASIGAVQWAWRRLLATDDVKYADAIERLLLNGFISGVSLSGNEFFYVNALQIRSDAVADDHRQPVNGRQQWFHTACCPPNVMRTLAQLSGYFGAADADGLVVAQYAPAELGDGVRGVRIDTDYPWDGRVTATIDKTDGGQWSLRLRVPAWCTSATITDPSGETTPAQPGWVTVRRDWQVGDTVVLDLPLDIRLTRGHPRVDAVRGCRAIERGPLVFAIEQTDLTEKIAVDDLELSGSDPSTLSAERRDDLLGGCVVVTGTGVGPDGAQVPFTAVPYSLWANREVGPMRVWIPLAEAAAPA